MCENELLYLLKDHDNEKAKVVKVIELKRLFRIDFYTDKVFYLLYRHIKVQMSPYCFLIDCTIAQDHPKQLTFQLGASMRLSSLK